MTVSSADTTLSRIDEVDIEGGWRVGDKYVYQHRSFRNLLIPGVFQSSVCGSGENFLGDRSYDEALRKDFVIDMFPFSGHPEEYFRSIRTFTPSNLSLHQPGENFSTTSHYEVRHPYSYALITLVLNLVSAKAC